LSGLGEDAEYRAECRVGGIAMKKVRRDDKTQCPLYDPFRLFGPRRRIRGRYIDISSTLPEKDEC